VPNVVNMADGATPPILNPESVSWYDGLYDVRRCHAAETGLGIHHAQTFL
jgi:hypothetical protein